MLVVINLHQTNLWRFITQLDVVKGRKQFYEYHRKNGGTW